MTTMAAAKEENFRDFVELSSSEQQQHNVAPASAHKLDDKLSSIRSNIIGANDPFEGPFGERQMVYADWIASGRGYRPIETYISDQVLPYYANTHTSTSVTGLQSTCFRHEARQIIQQSVNANTIKDVVLFTGSGTTAAVNKLVNVLGLNMPTSQVSPDQRPVVFVGPYEHHSNLLPWRESCADVVQIQENRDGSLNVDQLAESLREYAHRPLKIGSFSACSNVTGIMTNVNQVTALLHRNGALACWDYACAGPYVNIDMNPVVVDDEEDRAFLHKDAVFLSPHKFLGGVNTPGVLIAKKSIFSNPVPSAPNLGGGTVFFVKESTQRYLSNRVEREEGGTPDVVGAIRAGLAFQLKETVGADAITEIEQRLWETTASQFAKHPNIALLGYNDALEKQAEHVAIFSFLIRHGKSFLHYNFVSALLNDLYGIQTRGGCMCAGPYAIKLLGLTEEAATEYEDELVNSAQYCEYLRPGFTRLSFPYFMSQQEVDFISSAVTEIAEHGWRLLPLYRFNPKTGEWKHKSRITKFPTRKWLTNADLFSTPPVETTVVSPANGIDHQAVLVNAKKEMLAVNPGKLDRLGDQKQLFNESAEKLKWFVLPSEALDELNKLAKQVPVEDTAAQVKIEPANYFKLVSDAVVGGLPKVSRPPKQQDNKIEVVVGAKVESGEKVEFGENGKASEAVSTSAKNKSGATNFCDDGQCFVTRKKDKYPLRPADSASVATTATAVVPDGVGDKIVGMKQMATAKLFPKPPKKMMSKVGNALMAFEMIKEGDRLLLGLSGGKDSLCLLHILLAFQKRAPINFHIGACTIDPGTTAFDPSPLIPYMESLGVEYHYVRQNIFEDAQNGSLQGTSICAFCARMKRGALYSCARKHNYTTLVLAQHLDDFAESWLMSALYNGQMRTMKANYVEKGGDVRVIRPLVYVREYETKEFSYSAKLPVINENCPACFEAPQERKRIKKLLAKEEAIKPQIFNNIRRAILPLMDHKTLIDLKNQVEARERKAKSRGKRPTRTDGSVVEKKRVKRGKE